MNSQLNSHIHGAPTESVEAAVQKPVLLSVKGLYKLFGPDPQSVLPLLQEGMDKQHLQAEHGHVLGLNNIHIDMRAGDITVIMGLSGSGKSTLIRHLNRLIEPSAGQILIEGEDVLAMNKNALTELRRKRMSMVFQKFALFPHRTVLENTLLAAEIAGSSGQQEAALYWLERVGLKGCEKSYPHALSGGMQQRVGLARALASDADIMLMDEAFSALDPLIRSSMQDLLLELQQELHKTIVFITHDLDEALKLADHLVILRDGAVVQQGEPQGILLQPSDPYIQAFVADINRARVLRAGSVMVRADPASDYDGTVNRKTTLEEIITLADGKAGKNYEVVEHGKTVGEIHTEDVFKALVRVEPPAGTEPPT